MSDYPENVMEAAKTHLLTVLHEHKEMNPSQLDAVCGMDTLSVALGAMAGQGVPENVFTVGMKELMDAGMVEAWEDGAGWHYRLSMEADVVEFTKKLEEGAKRLEWAKPIVEAAIPEKRRSRLPFVFFVPIAEAIEGAREDEREACAHVCDELRDNAAFEGGDFAFAAERIRKRGQTPQTETTRAPSSFGQETLLALQAIRRALNGVQFGYDNNVYVSGDESARRYILNPGLMAEVKEALQAVDALFMRFREKRHEEVG